MALQSDTVFKGHYEGRESDALHGTAKIQTFYMYF